MRSGRIDLRFAPGVALFSGLIGGLLVGIARQGWQFVWPLIGIFGCVGAAWLFASFRRSDAEPAYFRAVVATSLLAVSFIAAVWGIASGVGL